MGLQLYCSKWTYTYTDKYYLILVAHFSFMKVHYEMDCNRDATILNFSTDISSQLFRVISANTNSED